jgi:hypothetical protein
MPRLRTLSVALSLLVCLATIATGQTTTASIVGIVTDPSGGAIIGANITVINIGT